PADDPRLDPPLPRRLLGEEDDLLGLLLGARELLLETVDLGPERFSFVSIRHTLAFRSTTVVGGRLETFAGSVPRPRRRGWPRRPRRSGREVLRRSLVSLEADPLGRDELLDGQRQLGRRRRQGFTDHLDPEPRVLLDVRVEPLDERGQLGGRALGAGGALP